MSQDLGLSNKAIKVLCRDIRISTGSRKSIESRTREKIDAANHQLDEFCEMRKLVCRIEDKETKVERNIEQPTIVCSNLSSLIDEILYLLQLRVGLTPLRYHKKCHNFIDTPSDICLCNNGIEDTNHFLFLCPFFAIHRATLASNVIQILQKYNLNHLGNQLHLYIYGHPIINLADNRIIILSTIKYIKESRRFSM